MITNYKIYEYNGAAARGATFDYQGRCYRVRRNGEISVEYQCSGYYRRYWVSRNVNDSTKLGRAIRCALNAIIETN